jgi:glycosyltransferase involved in cell wall biosynthesis
MPMRVLHVTEAPVAGVVSMLEEIVPWQHSTPRIGRVVILAPSAALVGITASDSALPFDFEARNLRGIFRLARIIAATVDAESPDIVHLHSTFAGLAGRMALGWRRKRPRIIYCAHGWSFVRRASWFADFVARQTERRLSSVTDCIVCVSHGDRDAALAIGIAPGRCRVVLNGIGAATPLETLATPDWPAPGLRLIFIGRFDRQKGHDILVDAMRRVRTPLAMLSIGASSETLSALDLPANMRILGWTPRDAVQSLLARADAVVMPSRWEGLPMVAIEAMRAGVAVIAAAIPGLIEVVEDGVTGRLFPAEDAAALALVLDSLDSTSCAAMGAQGHERFTEFYAHERMNTDLLTVYDELLQHSDHPRPARSLFSVSAKLQQRSHDGWLGSPQPGKR